MQLSADDVLWSVDVVNNQTSTPTSRLGRGTRVAGSVTRNFISALEVVGLTANVSSLTEITSSKVVRQCYENKHQSP